MNNVSLIGRLTRDPELRYIPNSGQAVSEFTLAIDKGFSKEKKADAEAKKQPKADFIRIVVWGKTAENCANHLKKGRLVGVSGRLQSSSYEANDGTKRYKTDVVANSVEFLEWDDKPNNSNKSSESSQSYESNDYAFGFDNDDIPF